MALNRGLFVGLGMMTVGALLGSPGPIPALGSTVQEPDTSVLLRLEDQWADGLVRRDVGIFRRLLADGFVYTENDRTSDREAVLHDLVATTDTVEAAHNEDMRVHRFGTTAIVTGWLIVRGHGPSGRFTHRYRFTDTWVRRGSQWQVVAAQDYLTPEPSQ